jgi:cation:H+ antiporter
MLAYVLAFLSSVAAVAAAGTVLTRSADNIAETTGIGRAWIGAVLLATGTSLPELATDIAAVRMHAPNLGAGDLFGSSLANMLILALIDQLSRRGSVLRGAALENALIACLAIVLNALGALFVLIRPHSTVLGVSPEAALMLVVYLAGTRAVYRNGERHVDASESAAGDRRPKARGRSLTWSVVQFVACALAITAVAPLLAWSAKHIAELSGLGTTFVGTWMVGLSTSLPEFVTSFAAVRMGAFDLAVGNLFGSNCFNMVIFFALDLANPSGSIFSVISPDHAIAGGLAVVLMGLGLAGILYRAERRFVMVEPDSLLMIAAYVFSLWIAYQHSVVW